jgi:uncharacterized protein
MLIKKIKKELTIAMKDGNNVKKMALRMIIGEIPRLNLKAGQVPTDEQVQKIIRSLIKSETLVCEYSGKDVCDNEYLTILNSYLPKMMNEAEIKEWIINNVNSTQYIPIIKAMGFIMKELKGKADGNMVKKVLQKI